MKTDVISPIEGSDPKIIATFGGARLVRILGKAKRMDVRGGTEEEQGRRENGREARN